MTKRWLIPLLIAGLFGGKAFADCVPSPDTPAPVIEYFKSFNKPLPERFCAKEDAAPQASEESPQEPPQACEDAPEASQVMAALKDQTTKLGAPKLEGKDVVGGKDAPVLYFGSTKMNNNVAVVDEVAKKGCQGVAATVFVKDGDEFVRVATTLAKPDKTGRAIGTVLDPGPAPDALKSGKAYNGDVSLFNKPYVASYEPITDASGAVIGAYFVGIKK